MTYSRGYADGVVGPPFRGLQNQGVGNKGESRKSSDAADYLNWRKFLSGPDYSALQLLWYIKTKRVW